MNKSAVGLYSGGLDSILAAKLVVMQGFYTILIRYVSPVFEPRRVEDDILSRLLPANSYKIYDIEMGMDFFLMLQSPKYGYGKNVNPCLDCKILMLKKAGDVLKEEGAAFVFTGEIVGQRPMSQRKDALRIIEKESGLAQYLLRPLSARLLPPTRAEELGLIDRESLLDISGRSRKRQMELAKQFGISYYPAPGGGCLLTDVNLARRFKILFSEQEKGLITKEDIQLLRVGRHFLMRTGLILVIGRNHAENERIFALARSDDWIFQPSNIAGPVSLVRGKLEAEDFQFVASITARYCDTEGNQEVEVSFKLKEEASFYRIKVFPASDDILTYYRL